MAKSTKLRQRRVRPRAAEISASQPVTLKRCVITAILGTLLLGGIITRVHFLGRSLWLDEAWVANSLQAATLRGALFYDEWLQTTPPLFIVLGRFGIFLLGTSNAALRALPALSGIFAVFVFAFLAVKLLKPYFALLALTVFIVSPRLIVYSQSLKQYSSDVLATVVLLGLGIVYLEKPTDRWFYGLVGGAVVLSFLSYSAMVFLPFVVFCAFARSGAERPIDPTQTAVRLRWRRGVLAVTAAMFVSVINYFVFIAPNKNPALAEFFHDGFYAGTNPARFLAFYGGKFATLADVFFFGGPGPLRVGALLITIIGFFGLWAAIVKTSSDANGYYLPVLLTTPIAGVFVLNLLGVFPMPGFQHRVLLFLFPITTLLFCFGLQLMANLISRLLGMAFVAVKATAVESALGAVALCAMAALAWLFFNTIGLTPFFAEEHEDSEEAVAFLRERVGSADVFFIHPSMREQYKLYTRTQPIAAQRTIFGKVGMPCCPRHDYRPPQQGPETEIIDEITSLKNAAAGRRLWVLMTNRRLHWVHMRRNDIEIFERQLAEQDCQKLGEKRFIGVYVAGFGCNRR